MDVNYINLFFKKNIRLSCKIINSEWFFLNFKIFILYGKFVKIKDLGVMFILVVIKYMYFFKIEKKMRKNKMGLVVLNELISFLEIWYFKFLD